MKPEEARKWAELYTAIADGKTWQIQSSAGEWNDATNGVHDPRGWSIERLRIKPEPQHETLNGNWNQSFDPGMTLRDYLAAKALFGLIAEPPWAPGASSVCSRLCDGTRDEALNFATAAYRLADAMLKARELP